MRIRAIGRGFKVFFALLLAALFVAVAAATPAYATAAAGVSIDVNSFVRNATTGLVTYDITGSASNLSASGTCPGYPFSCTMKLTVQYPDGSTHLLDSQDIADPSVDFSYDFSNTISSAKIAAFQISVASAATVSTDWTKVDDSYPGSSASVVVSSVGRDGSSGDLTLNMTGTVLNSELPDAACPSTDDPCDMKLEAQLDDDGYPVTLEDITMPATVTSAYSHTFSTPESVAKVDSVRIEVDGGHHRIYGPWVSVVDPDPAAAVDTTVTSAYWDSATQAIYYDVTGDVTASNNSDAVCGALFSTCAMHVQAEDESGDLFSVDSFTMPSGPGSSYSHEFFGSYSTQNQIIAMRTYVVGSSATVYSNWANVAIDYPDSATTIDPGTFGRTSGNFTFDVTGGVSNFKVPGAICDNTSDTCAMTLEGQDSQHNLVTLAYENISTGGAGDFSYEFNGSSSAASAHLTDVRIAVTGWRGTQYSSWESVSDPLSDPTPYDGSASVSVTSVHRNSSTGALEYDITGSASGYNGSGGVCNHAFDLSCQMVIVAEYASGGTETLGYSSFSTTPNSYSNEFVSSIQSAKIVAVEAMITDGWVFASSGWTSVSDSFPTQSVSVAVTSPGVDRDATTGRLTFTVTGSASNYGLSGAVCSDTSSNCSMNLQGRETDGTIVSLGEADRIGGNSYPHTESFSGPVSVPQVAAVRAAVYGFNTAIYSAWTSVTDPYGTSNATATVNSIGRDPATGDLTFSVSATAANYYLAGGPCLNDGSSCNMIVQAHEIDGTIVDLLSASYLSHTYPYAHTFDSTIGSADLLPQIDKLRVLVAGWGGVMYSAWASALDPYPTVSTGITVNRTKRDSDNGNLNYSYTVDASDYTQSNGPVCDPTSGSCNVQLQAEEADGTVLPLGYVPNLTADYPETHTFSGDVYEPQIVAVRAVVTGYNGQYISKWTTVNDPWTHEDEALNAAEKNCGCTGGDPVQTGNGEFDQSATDDSIAGAGPALAVTRSYASTNAATDGAFGYGWSPNFDATLNMLTPGNTAHPLPVLVEIVQENGATVQFTRQSNGTYKAPVRVFAALSYNATTAVWTYTRGATQLLTFDSSGHLTAFKDLNGNAVSVGRTSGDVTSLTASGSRAIDLTWTSGHVTGLTDSAGRTVSYGYDGSGNLTSVTAVDGSVQHYAYDSSHRLTTMTDPLGGATTNVYDTSGRVTSQTDPMNRTTAFAYDGDVTTTTNPDGSKTVDTYIEGRAASQTKDADTALAATTHFTYDAAGDLKTETDPMGKTTAYTYDSAGNELTKTDPLGHKTTWTYDALNDVTSTKDPLGRETFSTFNSAGQPITITSPSGRVQNLTYNSDGTLASSEDARGKTATFTYNSAGDQTGSEDPDSRATATGYNSAGFVTSKTDGAGQVTTLTVDAAGRVLTSTDPNAHTTTYTYDLDGNPLTIEDPNGHTTTKTYDADGELSSVLDPRGMATNYTYTASGALATTTNPDSHTTTNTYNLLGELTSVADANSHTTTYTYDADGRKLTTTLPSGNETSTTYDVAGRATTSTDAKDKVTTTAYDADNEPTSVTDPLSHTTSTSYTADGQVHVVTLPDSSTETYSYNGDAQTTGFTNADGKTTTYTYDDADLLTSKIEPSSQETDYSYDSAGRAHVTTNPDGSTLTETYDDAGQLTREHSNVTGSTDITYTYDPSGRRSTMSDETGTTTYSYNANGQILGVTNGAGAHVAYSYDNAGLMSSIDYPGSHSVTYNYDPVGQMASLTDWSSNETDFSWTPDGQLHTQADANGVTETRTYDADDQATNIADANGSTSLASYSYGYDNAGDINSDGTTDPIATVAHTYSHNADSQLTTVTHGSTTAAYGATSAGELTADTAGDTLAYNASQEITSLTPNSGPATSYGYDGNGSRTDSTVAAAGSTPAATTTYTYDAEQNLASVTLPGATTASVSYTTDGAGLRQSRTVGSTTTNFTWDVSGQLPLLLDDGVDKYIYGPSSAPIAQIADGTGVAQYLHGDLIGSTRLITNGVGAIDGTTENDPYGNRTNHSGSGDSAIGYSGNWTDSATGLIYLRARDYDPSTEQFLTVDPDEDTTRQPYAYTADDPLNSTDSTGLDCSFDTPGYECGTSTAPPAITPAELRAAIKDAILDCQLQALERKSYAEMSPAQKWLYDTFVVGQQEEYAALQPAFPLLFAGFGDVATAKVRPIKAGGEMVDFTPHTLTRMSGRVISLEEIQKTVNNPPFYYRHNGAVQTGYYDPSSKIFVATRYGVITTVIRNVRPKYIANLKGK